MSAREASQGGTVIGRTYYADKVTSREILVEDGPELIFGAPTHRIRHDDGQARCRGGRYHDRVHGLIRRLSARLGRDRRASGALLGLPCFVCGEPATGWAFDADVHSGTQVIEGFAACATHQMRNDTLSSEKAG